MSSSIAQSSFCSHPTSSQLLFKRKREEAPYLEPQKKAEHSPLDGVIPSFYKDEAPFYFAKYEELVEIMRKTLIARQVYSKLFDSLADNIRQIMRSYREHHDRLVELSALAVSLYTVEYPKRLLDSQGEYYNMLVLSLEERLEGYKERGQYISSRSLKKELPSLYRYSVLEEFSKILFLKGGEFNPGGAALITKMLQHSRIASFVKEDHYDHLLHFLRTLPTLKSVTVDTVEIAPDMEPYIRSIVMKGDQGDLTHVDLCRAVLISLMSRYRQGDSGICYAIAPIRDAIQNHSGEMYEWLYQFYRSGMIEVKGNLVSITSLIEMHIIRDRLPFSSLLAEYGTIPMIKEILARHRLESIHSKAKLDTVLASESARSHFYHHYNEITTLPLTLAVVVLTSNERTSTIYNPTKEQIIQKIAALASQESAKKKEVLLERLASSLFCVNMFPKVSGDFILGAMIMDHGPFEGTYECGVDTGESLTNVMVSPTLFFSREDTQLNWCKSLSNLQDAIAKILPEMPPSFYKQLEEDLVTILIESSEKMEDSWGSFMVSNNLCFVAHEGSRSLNFFDLLFPKRTHVEAGIGDSFLAWSEYIGTSVLKREKPLSTVFISMDRHAFTLDPQTLLNLGTRFQIMKTKVLERVDEVHSTRRLEKLFFTVNRSKAASWIKQLRIENKPKTFKEAALVMSKDGQHANNWQSKLFETIAKAKAEAFHMEAVLKEIFETRYKSSFRCIAENTCRAFKEPQYPHVYGQKLRKLMIRAKLPAVSTPVLAEKIATVLKVAPIIYIGDSNWEEKGGATAVGLTYNPITDCPSIVLPHKRGVSFQHLEIKDNPSIVY